MSGRAGGMSGRAGGAPADADGVFSQVKRTLCCISDPTRRHWLACDRLQVSL
jgi:hypothetical protein